jgi:hypothetical protein
MSIWTFFLVLVAYVELVPKDSPHLSFTFCIMNKFRTSNVTTMRANLIVYVRNYITSEPHESSEFNKIIILTLRIPILYITMHF